MKTVVILILFLSAHLSATSLKGQQLELVVQTGHSGPVTSAAFSPDGKMIASSGSEGTVKLWDVETGLQIRELSTRQSVYFQPADFSRLSSIGDRKVNGKQVHAEWHLVNELFYSRNSIAHYLSERFTSHTRSLLAKHHDHPTIELLKALTQELNQALKDPALYQGERFKSVKLSAETRALMEKNPVGEDLIKLNRSLLQDVFPDHLKRSGQEAYQQLIFSHDGRLVAGRSHGEVRIWSLETGNEVSIYPFMLYEIAFSPDDKTLVVVQGGDDLGLYDTGSGSLLTMIRNAPFVELAPEPFLTRFDPKSIEFSADGKTLISIVSTEKYDGSKQRATVFSKRYWQVSNGKDISARERSLKARTDGDKERVGKFLSSNNDAAISYETINEVKDAAGNSFTKYAIRLANLDTGIDRTILEGERPTDDFGDPWVKDEKISPVFNYDGSVLAVAKGRSIVLYSATNAAKIRDYNFDYTITGLSWSRDSSRFAVVSGSAIAVFDLKEEKTRSLLVNHVRRRRGRFDANRPELVFDRDDDEYQAFDLKGGKILSTNVAIEAHPNVLFISKKWNVATGAILGTTETRLDEIDEHPPQVVAQRNLSPDGRIFAEPDKNTINLTDNKTGTLIRVLSGHLSTVETVVFSPDGKTLASGSADNTIKLWDVATGKQLHSFTGFPYSAGLSKLVFSKDGELLAGSSENQTVKIWEVKAGTERNSFHQDQVLALAFSPRSDLLAIGGVQGVVKIWNTANNQELFALSGHSDDVLALAFNESGDILASAGRDTTIKLWDIKTGHEVRTLNDDLNAVIYLGFANANELISEGVEPVIEVRDQAKKETIQNLRGVIDASTRILLSPDRKILALYDSEGIRFLETQTGKRSFEIKWNKKSEIEITQNEFDGFYDRELATFGKDKFAVAFRKKKKLKTGNNRPALETNIFTLKLWNIAHPEKLDSQSIEIEADRVETLFFSPDGRWLIAAGSRIWLWDSEDPETLLMIPEFNFFGPSKIAISSDNKVLAVERHFDKGISLWDLTTLKQVGHLTAHPSGTYNLAFETDKNILMSQGYDGTTRFWNVDTGRELATLMLLDKLDWVVISPDGRFDASPNAMKLMHYVYGLEVITLEQLKDAYYEPGLLAKLIGLNNEPLRMVRPLRDVKLYPEIVKQELKSDGTILSVQLRNRGGGIGPLRIAVNGKTVSEDARDQKLKANPSVRTATVKFDLTGSPFLKGKPNKIEVFTNNYDPQTKLGYISSRGSELLYAREAPNKAVVPPKLYGIIGGVSDYAGGLDVDLRFSSKDAEDVATAISLSAKRLFGADGVQLTVLSTSGNPGTVLPTKENFRAAFAEVAKHAKAEDIFFVYLSGHGVSLGLNTDTYFFLTQEATSASKESLANPHVRASIAISSNELIEWLVQREWTTGEKGIKALKQVMVLDTCAAGIAGEQFSLVRRKELSSEQIRAIERLKDRTGFYVLMGSTADTPSYEASQYGQGLLTYSLLQGMRGAALREGEFVDVLKLFQYAEDEVPKLAGNIGGIQRPILAAPLGSSFDIGQLNEADRRGVPLATVKPILLRPRFSTGEEGDDALNLIQGLGQRLEEASYARSQEQATLVYVPDGDLPGGIRVTGTYAVSGQNVSIKSFLRRDGKTISTLPEVRGSVASLSDLLDLLMKEIREALTQNSGP